MRGGYQAEMGRNCALSTGDGLHKHPVPWTNSKNEWLERRANESAETDRTQIMNLIAEES